MVKPICASMSKSIIDINNVKSIFFYLKYVTILQDFIQYSYNMYTNNIKLWLN